MTQVQNKALKGILFAAGTISLGLGIIGIIIPLLPTTPFLILTSICYAKSSKQFHRWLLNNKLFGDYIKNYQEGKGIPKRTKLFAIAFLWITIVFSSITAAQEFTIRLILIFIAIAVTYHLVTIPTLLQKNF